jgi:hypothetical protein
VSAFGVRRRLAFKGSAAQSKPLCVCKVEAGRTGSLSTANRCPPQVNAER